MRKNFRLVEPAEWPFQFFRPWEIACSCCGDVLMTSEALTALSFLDGLRATFGEVMVVNSGYRCPRHNAAVGGARSSMHLRGMAFDIYWERWSEYKRRRFLAIAGSWGMRGIGQYPTFVHVDAREGFAFWQGP